MIKSVWKSVMGTRPFRETIGAIGAIIIFVFLFAMIGYMIAMNEVEEDPAPVINQFEQQIQQDLYIREKIRSIEADLQEIKSELERILGAGEFEATAYTHVAVPGLADINGTGDGITASGIPVREGLCAVDPTVIPLGSKVWVEGFGVLTAADTGGAIKGNRIDVFMDSRKEALSFGRRPVMVVWHG